MNFIYVTYYVVFLTAARLAATQGNNTSQTLNSVGPPGTETEPEPKKELEEAVKTEPTPTQVQVNGERDMKNETPEDETSMEVEGDDSKVS